MINPANILAHEIIGLKTKITESTDYTLRNVEGLVILETKNMILLRTKTTVKKIPKITIKKIEIKTNSGVCFISGSSMIGRPEDRITRLDN